MKFDPQSWNEVKPNVEIAHEASRLRLLLSRPAAIFATAQGVEVLAGYGTEIDIKTEGLTSFLVDTDNEDLRAFVHRPYRQPASPVGEVLTNMDRQPHQSGAVLEVQQALRSASLQIAAQNKESRDILQAIRKERQTKPVKPPEKTHDEEFAADPSDPAIPDPKSGAKPDPSKKTDGSKPKEEGGEADPAAGD